MYAREHFLSTVVTFGDAVAIVSRLRIVNDEAAKTELYTGLQRYVYPYLLRNLRDPHTAQNELHEIWMIVYQAVIDGSLKEPCKLFGFARTVAMHRINSQIKAAIISRKRHPSLSDPASEGLSVCDPNATPDETLEQTELRRVITDTLNDMHAHERDILWRFYILEQKEPEIREAMNLTSTQYRLLKCRAKAKFGQKALKKFEGSKVQRLVLQLKATEERRNKQIAA